MGRVHRAEGGISFSEGSCWVRRQPAEALILSVLRGLIWVMSLFGELTTNE